MSDTQDKKIIGFFNKNKDFPTGLITVVQSDGACYGVWASGDVVKLINKAGTPALPEEFSLRETFIAYAGNKTSTDFKDLVAYALSENEIEVGSLEQITEMLGRESGNTLRSEEDREALASSHSFLLTQRANDPQP